MLPAQVHQVRAEQSPPLIMCQRAALVLQALAPPATGQAQCQDQRHRGEQCCTITSVAVRRPEPRMCAAVSSDGLHLLSSSDQQLWLLAAASRLYERQSPGYSLDPIIRAAWLHAD